MKRKLSIVALLFFSSGLSGITVAQNIDSSTITTSSQKVKRIILETNPTRLIVEKEGGESREKQITEEEKKLLAKKIKAIQERVKNGEITTEEGEVLKKEAAIFHAENIERRMAQNTNNKIAPTPMEYEKRTGNNQLIIGFGWNNTLSQGEMNNQLYQFGKSLFFEIGESWTTRLMRTSNLMRINYGFSFQFNNLSPTNNQYFVNKAGGITAAEPYPLPLRKSQLRVTNLVVPLHFEFGPSVKYTRANKIRFSKKQFKIGVGGYTGINIAVRQRLKYNDNEGSSIKEIIKNNYSVNKFIYGLSAYAGWGGTSFYLKYDLNPLFKSPNTIQNNISIGLRLAL